MCNERIRHSGSAASCSLSLTHSLRSSLACSACCCHRRRSIIAPCCCCCCCCSSTASKERHVFWPGSALYRCLSRSSFCVESGRPPFFSFCPFTTKMIRKRSHAVVITAAFGILGMVSMAAAQDPGDPASGSSNATDPHADNAAGAAGSSSGAFDLSKGGMIAIIIVAVLVGCGGSMFYLLFFILFFICLHFCSSTLFPCITNFPCLLVRPSYLPIPISPPLLRVFCLFHSLVEPPFLSSIFINMFIVFFFLVASAALFYIAKKRQWDIRKSLRRSARRLTGNLSSARSIRSMRGGSRRNTGVPPTPRTPRTPHPLRSGGSSDDVERGEKLLPKKSTGSGGGGGSSSSEKKSNVQASTKTVGANATKGRSPSP